MENSQVNRYRFKTVSGPK